MRVVAPDDAGFAEAVAALREGKVVAYPTETVYGLAVDPMSEHALDALFEAKGRDAAATVLLIVADRAQLGNLVVHVDAKAEALMTAFWPGPLSLILTAKPGVPARLLNEEGGICVRHTPHPIARRLAHEFGGAITSTSANRSGEPPAPTPGELAPGLAAVCMDGGKLAPAQPSTVYDCARGRVLRQGAVSLESIQDALRRQA